MNYLLLLLIVALTIFLKFTEQRKKAFSGNRNIYQGVFVAGLVNIVFCFAFNRLGVLKYEPEHLSRMFVAGVPVEQILLSFVLPYAVLVVYGCLQASRPIVKADKYSLSISNVVMGLCIAMIFFAYNKAFAVVTFSSLLLTLFYVEYRSRLRFMLPFYRTFAITMILFLIIFVPLHQLSIYKYSREQTIELSIAFIPFESYFYFLWMSLVTVMVYEVSKRRI